jgi:integrase
VRGKISKSAVEKLGRGEALTDTEIKGFIVRCLPKTGTITYGYRYRTRVGKQRWLPLGQHGQVTPEQARDLAKKRAGEVANDRDPTEERAAARATEKNTVNVILDEFMIRYVRGQKLRSADEIERAFKVYIRPRIGDRSIYDLGRNEIVKMLDEIEDENGPVMADRVLAYVRKCFNWHSARDERFRSPVVIGMARTKPKERERRRYLDDQEIRDLWRGLDELAADGMGPYARFVSTLLFTGQRRSEVSQMPYNEIMDDLWLIPKERAKNKVEHAVPLTKTVRALFGTGKKSDFVFSTTGGTRPISGYTKAKKILDQKIAGLRKQDKRQAMPHWTNHDLRRTARSLMSRAGVSADIGERVINHKIGGVRGVYDRYEFFDEKKDALERLEGLIKTILNPPSRKNVIPLRGKAKARADLR